MVLVGCDPLSVTDLDWEVSSMRDNVASYRYASIDPAHHLDGFDEAALRQALDRAKGQGATMVLVSTNPDLARDRLADLLAPGDQIEVVIAEPKDFFRDDRSSRGHESQDSVKAWCDLHYPDEREDLEIKALNLAEEIGELIAALGLDAEAFADRVVRSASRSAPGRETREEIEGEFADSQIALFDLASTEGVKMDPTLIRKMAKLRTRRPAESAERQIRKAALGL